MTDTLTHSLVGKVVEEKVLAESIEVLSVYGAILGRSEHISVSLEDPRLVQPLEVTALESKINRSFVAEPFPIIKEQMQCTKCPEFFYSDVAAFRQHCHSEWHISNVRRSAAENGCLPGLSYKDWMKKEEVEEGESEEGSSDEEDFDPTSPEFSSSQGALHELKSWRRDIRANFPWFVHFSGVALPACHVKEINDNGIARGLLSLLSGSAPSFSIVLLVRSGRLAAALFDSTGCVIDHTSSKRYTVRRKAGGAQAYHDHATQNQGQKSAGSQIRRSQEKVFLKDLSEVIDRWKGHFSSSRVLLSVPKRLESSVFIGMLKGGWKDDRVFRIPLACGKPTFAEVCRVHDTLMRISLGN